ncbi:MAG TPA: hypothetical protein VGF28_18765 [Thermoanaerobaculia bacterium]|jgi:hypothetical protein
MDEETRLVPAQVTGALTDEKTSALVPVAPDEVSTRIVAAIDLIASLIPDLRTPHPRTEKKVRGGRTIPREAVLAVIAMVESSAVIRSLNLFDPEHGREVVEFDDGYRLLDERLERLRRQVRYTVEARWAEVASTAMDAYMMAKRLARDPRYADLAAHVTIIARHLDRTNTATARTKKKRDPE